ncbi:hypothetical protein JCM33374_g2955 [Metschnikowia sp. JCM 33374]|nr:hypothetical protein JCM33374_g2955 [Metschnikowia sp. JCM 33374]
MKGLHVLVLLSMAFALETICVGTMHISMVGNKPVHKNIGIDHDRLVVSDEVWLFEYTVDGVLKLSGIEKYLSVSKAGKLVLNDTPHTGFILLSPDPRNKAVLTYKGKSSFKWSSDQSIGVKMDDGRSSVLITFEDIIQTDEDE